MAQAGVGYGQRGGRPAGIGRGGLGGGGRPELVVADQATANGGAARGRGVTRHRPQRPTPMCPKPSDDSGGPCRGRAPPGTPAPLGAAGPIDQKSSPGLGESLVRPASKRGPRRGVVGRESRPVGDGRGGRGVRPAVDHMGPFLKF